jgi:hypothetical protein
LISVLLLAFATTVAVYAAKALEKLTPLKPVLKNEFSDTPLKAFLLEGSKDH